MCLQNNFFVFYIQMEIPVFYIHINITIVSFDKNVLYCIVTYLAQREVHLFYNLINSIKRRKSLYG